MTSMTKKNLVLAFVAAALIAALGFAVGEMFGEGAGVPVVLLVSTLWCAYFVSRSRKVAR